MIAELWFIPIGLLLLANVVLRRESDNLRQELEKKNEQMANMNKVMQALGRSAIKDEIQMQWLLMNPHSSLWTKENHAERSSEDEMIYFTSDTHFGHANIIEYCKRPFRDTLEMDSMLIEKWNERIGVSDTIYHLGDFTLGKLDFFETILWQLNGRLRILPGSHDHRWLEKYNADDPYLHTFHGYPVELLPPLVSLEFPELGDGKYPQVVTLCHYAMRVWDRSHYGSWHLFGHSHGTLRPERLSMDVGVDCNAFAPVSLDEVAKAMREKKGESCNNLQSVR